MGPTKGWGGKITMVRLVLSIVLALILGGCATTSGDKTEIDPYEDFNRKMFSFNSTVDEYIAEPVAGAYTKAAPEVVQTGVTNFFQNLSNLNVILNDFLQGKVEQGFQDSGRFVINTTVGILGLFDVAEKIGWDRHNEDFGQTLAVWGIDSGPYLVLPFLGPTTVRGTPSFAVEALTNPLLTMYPALMGLDLVETRARADGSIKFVNEAALDPYVFTRESFLQWRNFLISDGRVPVDEIDDDIEDMLFDDDEFEKINTLESDKAEVEEVNTLESAEAETEEVNTLGSAEAEAEFDTQKPVPETSVIGVGDSKLKQPGPVDYF